jgi:hypothetical protein
MLPMTVSATEVDVLLKPAEAAELTRLTVSTLKDHRWKGIGPPFVKLSPGRGGRIRYWKGDVLAWLQGESPEAA